jgi:hypothetical protein
MTWKYVFMTLEYVTLYVLFYETWVVLNKRINKTQLVVHSLLSSRYKCRDQDLHLGYCEITQSTNHSKITAAKKYLQFSTDTYRNICGSQGLLFVWVTFIIKLKTKMTKCRLKLFSVNLNTMNLQLDGHNVTKKSR